MSTSGATAALAPRADDPFVAELLARCRFPHGALEVAVSGGPDSTALLALAVASGAPVRAHHVEHGLRAPATPPNLRSPASLSDAELRKSGLSEEGDHVAQLCRRWGARFEGHRVQVGDGPDLERRCREARLAVLPTGCLTGHTADDQAETVLLRLLRGTGPGGLAAMSHGTHPLLDLRRSETVALCAHLRVDPLVDPTNDSPRFTRNRVRSEVLPLLSEVAGRDVVPLLSRTAALAAEQAELLDELVMLVDPTDAAAVSAAPRALATAALRTWWRSETDGLLPPDRAAVQRMLEVASKQRRACDVNAGWSLKRSGGRLSLVAPVGG